MGGCVRARNPLLGCAEQYTVEVYLCQRVDANENPLPRAQMFYLGNLEAITSIQWGRRLRDVSEAEIFMNFAQASNECCTMLREISEAVRVAQFRIFRDEQQVWEGELMQPIETVGSTVKRIVARDIFQRVDDTINDIPETDPALGPGIKYEETPVTEIAYDILYRNLTDTRYVDPIDDSLILDQVVVEAITDPDDVVNFKPGLVTAYVGEILRDLGQSYGLDFTVVNRSLRFQRRRTTRDQTYARLTTDHLLGDTEVRVNGLEAATRGWATTQLDGESEPTDPALNPEWPGKTESYGVTGSRYGRLDYLNRLQDRKASDSDVRSSAKRAAWGRNPPPTEILLPPQGRLSASTPLTMDELIPGMRIDFFAEDQLCRPIRQGMRLLAVDVEWNPGNAMFDQAEIISVELSTLSDVTSSE